jgi:hypothetical protein
MLGNIRMDLVAQAYGLDHNLYFTKLKDAIDATKWNDFTGEREADFKTIKPYHDKLGQLLGVEGKLEGSPVNVQINNIIQKQTEEFNLDE